MRFASIALVLLLTGCATQAETSAVQDQLPAVVSEQPSPEAEESSQAESAAGVDDAVSASSESESESTPTSSKTPTSSEPKGSKTSTPTATAEAKPSPTATRTPSPSPEPTVTSGPVGYTRAEVAAKNTRTACWVIVDGSVYDLTRWIGQHPGGAAPILALCGTDASEAFDAQHAGQARPSSTLNSYFLGPLID